MEHSADPPEGWTCALCEPVVVRPGDTVDAYHHAVDVHPAETAARLNNMLCSEERTPAPRSPARRRRPIDR